MPSPVFGKGSACNPSATLKGMAGEAPEPIFFEKKHELVFSCFWWKMVVTGEMVNSDFFFEVSDWSRMNVSP